jgi:hypothetical protein
MAYENSLLYNKEFNFLVRDNQVLFRINNDDIIEVLHSDKILNSLKVRLDIVKKLIVYSLDKWKLKITLDIIFNLDDVIQNDKITEFGFSKNIIVNKALVPNLYAMMDYSNLNIVNDDIKITQKTKKGIFVGATTGDLDPIKNKRLLYCNHFLNSEICDFYISKIVQINNKYVYGTYTYIKDKIIGNYNKKSQLNYKYIIDLDGNTTSWDRVKWVMGSNSLLLKEISDNVEWYYPMLKDGNNLFFYNSFKDLEYLVMNLNQMDDIYLDSVKNNANDFSKNFLNLDIHSYYFVNMLKFIMEGG